jgi:RNA polymerase sigma factor (sigma-70 family)
MPDDVDAASDEALVAKIASGDEEALRLLHRRYAPVVFTIASRAVDRPTAEEITQDVFVTLWTKHATFDAKRGTLTNWLCQIARNRAANARRHGKSRRSDDHDGEDALTQIEGDDVSPDEAQWTAQRKEALRRAIETLPSVERTALTLAFFDELSHEQIAATLKTPVGTTKTRIRGAIKRLMPLLLGLAVLGVAVDITVHFEKQKSRSDRALKMVTASDVVPLHLVPPGAPASPPPLVHGGYRGRAGSDDGVLTTSALPTPEAGYEYEAWLRHGDRWIWLGNVTPKSDGTSLLVAEDPSLATAPDEIRVTVETDTGARPSRRAALHEGGAPNGPTVLAWPPTPSPP